MHIVDEKGLPEEQHPGRRMRWLFKPATSGNEKCSACVIWVAPEEKVRPAHAHLGEEEIIYILSGFGSVMVNEEVEPVHPGSSVLFPVGAVHMLYNQSKETMKVVCFFAPATEVSRYQTYEEIDFPKKESK